MPPATLTLSTCPGQFINLAKSTPTQSIPTACSIWRTSTWCPGDASTKCMAGIATSSSSGLLRDGRTDLARGMVENFFFEIENYGALLNANRTYYLTRSQPPFLSSMVLAVYDAEKQAGHTDNAWLARAYSYLEKDYSMWTRDPHLAGPTALARYYDFGDGPPAEGLQDESGFYRKVVSHFAVHPDQSDHYLVEQNLVEQDLGHPELAKQDRAQAAAASGSSYGITGCDVSTTRGHPDCEPQHVGRLSA